LADIHRGDVNQALVNQLSAGTPPVQAEAARALGARGDKAAVPSLLDLAQRGTDSSRKAALRALSGLADDSQMPALVDLVIQAKGQAGRAEAVEAVNSAYQHLQTSHGRADVEPLVQGIQKSEPDARAALLSICGGLSDPKVRATLR